MSSAESSISSSQALASGKRNDIAIEIESMLNKAIEAEAPVIKECCIYKVPDWIRKLSNDAYTPKVVSIGPFHHSNQNMRKMEIHKKRYFKEFLKRSKTNLESLVSGVEEIEHMARCGYSENIEDSKEEFVKMILVDAGFIIELFCQFYQEHRPKDDALQIKSWLIKDIIMDLYLLENQLPFLFLEKLYNIAHPISRGGGFSTFLELASYSLCNRDKQMLVPKSTPILYFTDLLRESYLQPSERLPSRRCGMITTLPSVTVLLDIGVKFKADKRSQCLLGLQFSYGILQIPQLLVWDETEKLFCNIVALEERHYPNEQYVTDHVFLLSCLIKTDEDADILIKNGTIVNYLDHTNRVTRLFYNLGKNTPETISHSACNKLSERLHKFFQERKAKMVTTLKQDYYQELKLTYCKTPLQTLATLGGIFLLILTVIQTVCSILQVV